MVSIIAEKQAHKHTQSKSGSLTYGLLFSLKVRQMSRCFGGSEQLHQEL